MKSDFKTALEYAAFNKYSDTYITMQRNLMNKVYPESEVDTIFQGRYTAPSNVMAFAHIRHHINIGDIARLTIQVGDTPQGDKAVEQNNRILSDISPLFQAEFLPESGGSAWGDGYLMAKGDAIFERTIAPHVEMKYQKLSKYLVFDIRNQRIPLEVGYTEGHITYLHLLLDGAVARWAYGSSQIVVLITCNPLGEKSRSRNWTYHTATPLDFAIAKSYHFYDEPHIIVQPKAA